MSRDAPVWMSAPPGRRARARARRRPPPSNPTVASPSHRIDSRSFVVHSGPSPRGPSPRGPSPPARPRRDCRLSSPPRTRSRTRSRTSSPRVRRRRAWRLDAA